jgi:hypothetical protein
MLSDDLNLLQDQGVICEWQMSRELQSLPGGYSEVVDVVKIIIPSRVTSEQLSNVCDVLDRYQRIKAFRRAALAFIEGVPLSQLTGAPSTP